MLSTISKRLLEIAEFFEWDDHRAGCTRHHREAPLMYRSCPCCSGVKPGEYDPAAVFPAGEIDHKPKCELQRILRDLREMREL